MSSSSKRKKLAPPPNDINMEDTTNVAAAAAAAEESQLPLSWRLQSIQRFGLRPVPPAWASAVAGGTEEAWKKYYKYRCQTEGIKEEEGGDDNMDKEEQGDDDDDDYDWGDEDYGSKELMEEWKKKLGYMKYEAKDCGWQWTPKFGYLTWDDNEIRSAEYYCHVWSPFAIPHAIALEHRYHRRPRYSTMEFYTVWSYRLVDFEEEDDDDDDDDDEAKKYTELCSNCFEDEAMRASVIQTSNLNMKTVHKLRRFLYGSVNAESKKTTCSDLGFLLLLFGSMGTVDLGEDPKHGWLGYDWSPDEELRKKLFDDKVPEDGDLEEGDPPESIDNYYPSGCSWLRHRVLEITDNLGPIFKHYRHPTIKDAPGYRSPDDEESYDSEG
eukprot:CAMPEP_0198298156 /NCGR_PEP_ID=MMETSP1449-20131203/39851_1 /TAXON_ID=420275 /ORGANISM="Attheya septentrionalis, Strain CCMP2084" /LENGTH=380 /DNA_ID=CAMNT_0043999345 /DNA_START=105 /DNA_END=1247 /DNA_ORIENTATION=+